MSEHLAAPPSLDLNEDFAPSFDAYAHLLFDGLIELLPLLLGIVAVFTLLHIAVRSIRKWLGLHSATGPTGGYGPVSDEEKRDARIYGASAGEYAEGLARRRRRR